MDDALQGIRAEDGAAVAAADIPKAVTARRLVYTDGATQVFTADGKTTYTERGGDSPGEWYLDDQGRFCSFWPPSYRACYALRWMVDDCHRRIPTARVFGFRIDRLGFRGLSRLEGSAPRSDPGSAL